ncbi:hypothetical protein F4778DRAFT_800387 [Xylariomycetidae sp. FL2044]|nr:hypothetical protein F4778DRAFT_800387 [Xylariomycetidae sp. FL2044]
MDESYDRFVESLAQHELYPKNLIASCLSSSRLAHYHAKLTNMSDRLFVGTDMPSHSLFLDGGPDGKLVEVASPISGSVGLDEVSSASCAETGGEESEISRYQRDPQCRFIFLQASTLSPIKMSKETFCRILSYHQVMPQFLDIVSSFGRIWAPGLAQSYPAFACNMNDSVSVPLPQLGRSGRQLEICYNLKVMTGAGGSSQDGKKRYYIEQSAVYHQFDKDSGRSLWIIIDGGEKPERKEPSQLGFMAKDPPVFSDTLSSLRAAFDLQLDYFRDAYQSFLPYISDLEEQLEQQNQRINAIQFARERPMDVSETLSLFHHHVSKVKDATAALKSNRYVLGELNNFYHRLLQTPDVAARLDTPGQPGRSVPMLARKFTSDIRDVEDELNLQLHQLQCLTGSLDEKLSMIQQRNHWHSSARIEGIAQETQTETSLMRIITIVILMFLPGAFISTFFSMPMFDAGSSSETSDTGPWPDLTKWGLFAGLLTLVTALAIVALHWWEQRRRSRRRAIEGRTPGLLGAV